MKKGWKIVLILSASIVAVVVAAFGFTYVRYHGEIDVTTRGVVANDPAAAESNRKQLNKMLLLSHKGTVFVFPEGKYYIACDKSIGGLLLLNKNSVTLRGEGETVLVNTSYTPYENSQELTYMNSNLVNVIGGKNIVFDGLTIDYLEPTSVSGTISVTGSGITEIAAFDAYTQGPQALKKGAFAVCLNYFDEDGAPTGEVWLPADTALSQRADDAGTFLLAGNYGKVGQTVSIRFTCWKYTATTFNLLNVKGLTVKDVRFLSTPTACFFGGGDSENFSFERVVVASPDDSPALFCANGDGIHLAGLRGTLTLKDCRFVGMGDDALNIHVRAPLVQSVDGNTLTIAYAEDEAAKDFAKRGDEVAIYSESGALVGKATVTSVKGSTIRLDAMPSGVTKGALLNNESRQPVTVVDGVTVERSRARGLLIQCREATVKNCTFRNLRLPGILVSPDLTYWHEMGPCESITIENCVFERCCNLYDDNSTQWGAVTVTVGHDNNGVDGTAPTVHGTITLRNNTFDKRCKPYAIDGAENVVDENNVILP